MSSSKDWKTLPFESLKGLTLVEIRNCGKNDVSDPTFITDTGRVFRMTHHQDCCENVYVEDVNGDINDLLNSPIVLADEAVGDPPEDNVKDEDDSYGDGYATWTFYRLATEKGYVTIRWCGESNGYYSESVDFEEYC